MVNSWSTHGQLTEVIWKYVDSTGQMNISTAWTFGNSSKHVDTTIITSFSNVVLSAVSATGDASLLLLSKLPLHSAMACNKKMFAGSKFGQQLSQLHALSSVVLSAASATGEASLLLLSRLPLHSAMACGIKTAGSDSIAVVIIDHGVGVGAAGLASS
jgi:hypothetical protein